MISPFASQAADEAIEYGNALLKYISPNDVGKTGGHQSGYYLPIGIWKAFTANPPEKGVNSEEFIKIHWQDGRTTESRIVWYGKKKNEYRLTRFGNDFPYLTHDNVGDLLVLIKIGPKEFHAFTISIDDDVEELQAKLGVEIIGSWAYYTADHDGQIELAEESEEQCLNRKFRKFCDLLECFPAGRLFSEATWDALEQCLRNFSRFTYDDKLMHCLATEYELFRMAERKLCASEISHLFESVDDFLKTAHTILNRRKSRAGRALENHVEILLKEANLPFSIRPGAGIGRIDVIIPGEKQYLDPAYPVEKLFAVGIKTTCKDRWRQVLVEASRVPNKHILTTQKGISSSMLMEMKDQGLTLIVPKPLLRQYPKGSGMNILTVTEFINNTRAALNN